MRSATTPRAKCTVAFLADQIAHKLVKRLTHKALYVADGAQAFKEIIKRCFRQSSLPPQIRVDRDLRCEGDCAVSVESDRCSDRCVSSGRGTHR